MVRFAKIAAILLALGLVLAAAATLALKRLLPPEKARQLVTDSARKALKRELRLKDLSIGPLRGLVVSGLELSEAPDFKAGVFASASSFQVRVKLLPLLRKQLVVDSVTLEGLKLTLVRGKDGVLRLPQVGSPGPAAAPAAASAPLSLAVRKATLKDSEVTYRDEAGGTQWVVKGLSANVSDFGLDHPFDLETAFTAVGKAGTRPVDAAVAFSGKVDPARGDLRKLSVVIRKLSVGESGYVLKASGSAAAGPEPKADLKVSASDQGGELFSADVQANPAKAEGFTDARFVAATKGLPAETLARFGAPAGLRLPAGSAAGRLSVSASDLLIPDLQVKTQAGTVGLTVHVKGLRKPKPDVRAEAKLDLSLPALACVDLAWAKLPAGLSLPAVKVTGSLRLEGEEAFLEKLLFETAWGTAMLEGRIADLRGKPRPDLKADFKLDLPAFKSADLPYLPLPAGLSVSTSHVEGGIDASLDAARFRALRLKTGGSDLEADGVLKGLQDKLSADLMLKCRSFVLDELTSISPVTRELKLAGRGFFAIGVTGGLDKPLLAGKLQFSGVGATVAGLKLADFTGLAKFDERRIDVPNLKGLVADGILTMDLTVKDYAKAADIDLVAELSKFDLGAFMAAKAVLAKKSPTPAPSPAADQKPSQPSPIRAKGKLSIAKLVHPNASAQDAKLSWELEGFTPDFKTLDGWAKLSVAGGRFNDLGRMATQSPLVKVMVLPVVILQKIGGIGGIRIFPDLNNIEFTEIGGDYAFAKGMMNIRDSHLYSDAVHADTKGSIDLPSEKLDLIVTAQVGRVAPIDIGVTGTFEKPVTRAKIGKFLADPAKQLLQNIFKN